MLSSRSAVLSACQRLTEKNRGLYEAACLHPGDRTFFYEESQDAPEYLDKAVLIRNACPAGDGQDRFGGGCQKAGGVGKCCNAIGAGVLGILLQACGFISSTDAASVAQPDSAIFMIRCLYSLIPVVFMVISIIAAMNFNKLSRMMPRIEEELKARRA